jgi:hypothetical protein
MRPTTDAQADDDIAAPAEFLLTNDVARFLKTSAESVRKWERLGRLRALRTEQGVRIFHREDVERFARERAARRTHTEPQSAAGSDRVARTDDAA